MATPNMNLPLPTVQTTPGPTYAANINASLQAIDSHNHTAGRGVQIPAAALAIDNTLNLNGFALGSARSVRLVSQGAALPFGSDPTALYSVNGDLYYNSSTGAAIQLTAGAAINAQGFGGFTGDYVAASARAVFTQATGSYSFLNGLSALAPIYASALSAGNAAGSSLGQNASSVPYLLNVAGPSRLVGQVDTPGGLNTLTGPLTVGGATNLAAATLSGTLTGVAATFSGAASLASATVSGTLGVTGTTTLGTANTGALTASSATVTNNLTLTSGSINLTAGNLGLTAGTITQTTGIAALNALNLTGTQDILCGSATVTYTASPWSCYGGVGIQSGVSGGPGPTVTSATDLYITVRTPRDFLASSFAVTGISTTSGTAATVTANLQRKTTAGGGNALGIPATAGVTGGSATNIGMTVGSFTDNPGTGSTDYYVLRLSVAGGTAGLVVWGVTVTGTMSKLTSGVRG